jgi:hypothetical protein
MARRTGHGSAYGRKALTVTPARPPGGARRYQAPAVNSTLSSQPRYDRIMTGGQTTGGQTTGGQTKAGKRLAAVIFNTTGLLSTGTVPQYRHRTSGQ